MKLMRHIADVVGKEGVIPFEFKSSAVRRSPSLCFREGKNFVMMASTHCSRDVPVKGNVSMVGQLLSVVSTGPAIVCCGGADSDFIKAIDRDPTRKADLQYPFSLNPVQKEKLMHKPSFSVMAMIDIFSMLATLLVLFSGMLDEQWVQSTRCLRKLGFIAVMFKNHVSISRGLSGSCVLKALEKTNLDLHSAFLVVQEMLSDWAQIVSYISETGQRQEFQNMHGRVSLIIGAKLFVWFDVYFGDVTGSGFRCASDGRRIFRMRIGVIKGNCAGLP